MSDGVGELMQEVHDAEALSSHWPPSGTAPEKLINPVMLNTSGIAPTEFKVLILPKEVEEKTKGGIILAVETTEKEKWATIEGVLIAKAPLAFTYASTAEWAAVNAEPPPCGKRILFAKYSGVRHKGRDGVEYVIANDKDVLAILD
jgi:co-chaperonin GroES (HSP10)